MGVRWHAGDRTTLDDRRFDAPAVPTVADGVDGGDMKKKKPNASDLTTRNNNARKKEIAQHTEWITALTKRVEDLERLVFQGAPTEPATETVPGEPWR
jgi:hypothetical protein